MRADVPMLALVLLLASCEATSPDAFSQTEEGVPPVTLRTRLAISLAPMDAVLQAPFDLYVRVEDPNGNVDDLDSQTQLTVRLSTGTGTLRGTLTRTVAHGQARFDDLVYDRWEPIALTVSAPSGASLTTPEFPVRPLLRLKTLPATRVKVGAPLGPFQVELVDGTGAPAAPRAGQRVRLRATDPSATLTGEAEKPLQESTLTFEGVSFETKGAQTLQWESDGLPTLLQAVLVYDALKLETAWLPAGRPGLPYTAKLPAAGATYSLSSGALPRGLTLDTASGEIAGTPEAAVFARAEVVSIDAAGTPTVFLVTLPVLPTQPAAPLRSLDALNVDGPFKVGVLDTTVTVASRGKTEAIRIFFPSQDGAALAPGKFPVVVFHHGAANISNTAGSPFQKIFDRYDPLLRRWTSRGFLCVTIDGVDLIYTGNPPQAVGLSLTNLTGMSENQRAVIALLKERNARAGDVLAGHVDEDRILVSGHSRGGGASLITLRANPELLGGILLKPVDPIMAPGGDLAWAGPLPARPTLVTVAGNDGDVVYPICDFLFERRASLMSMHTLLGSVHNFTKSVTNATLCGPEGDATPEITREQDWALTNAYATAFLEYVGHGDLSYAPLLFDRAGLSSSLSPLGTLVHSDGFARPLVVDDFQDADAQKNALGQPTTAIGFSQSADEPAMQTAIASLPAGSSLRTLYSRSANLAASAAHRLAWSTAGASYKSALGSLDVRHRGAFILRARSDLARLPGSSLTVQLTDSSGKTAKLLATERLGRNGIAERYSDLIVPLEDVAKAGVDLSALASVELAFTAATGSVVLDDLRFE